MDFQYLKIIAFDKAKQRITGNNHKLKSTWIFKNRNQEQQILFCEFMNTDLHMEHVHISGIHALIRKL